MECPILDGLMICIHTQQMFRTQQSNESCDIADSIGNIKMEKREKRKAQFLYVSNLKIDINVPSQKLYGIIVSSLLCINR